MALDATQLSNVASGPNRLWVYGSGDDALLAVDGAGYFNALAETLVVGDVIIVSPTAGTLGLRTVTDITAGVVTIA